MSRPNLVVSAFGLVACNALLANYWVSTDHLIAALFCAGLAGASLVLAVLWMAT